jgi:hypothetical protein
VISASVVVAGAADDYVRLSSCRPMSAGLLDVCRQPRFPVGARTTSISLSVWCGDEDANRRPPALRRLHHGHVDRVRALRAKRD